MKNKENTPYCIKFKEKPKENIARFILDAKKKKKEYPHPRQYEFEYTEITPKEKDIIDNKKFIIGQKVTASWKAVTMVTKDWVYKGPYKITNPVLPLVYSRSQKFKKWCDDSFIENKIIRDGDIFYIKMPNIGDIPEAEYTWYLPGDRETKAMVAIRGSGGVIRASDEFKAKGKLPDKILENILYHFILRYITRSADTGLWNVINGKGIDFEEVRSEQNPTNLIEALFVKKPSKALLEEINKVLKKVKNNLYKKMKDCLIPNLEDEYNQLTGEDKELMTLERARAYLVFKFLE